MHAQSRRSFVLAILAAGMLDSCSQPWRQPNWAATSGGVTAYLGVAPSALVRAERPERILHPSGPAGDAHIIIALYDAASGSRIENASVEVRVRGERHRAERRMLLEPMRIEGTVTYGGFMSFAENDRYHIDVLVELPGSPRLERLRFLFDARGLPHAGELPPRRSGAIAPAA